MFAILACILGLIQAAPAHDLLLTRIVFDTSGTETSVTVYTPLSRLVRTTGLSSSPRPADLDLAVRARLDLWVDGARFAPSSAHIEIDTQNDMMAWKAPVAGRLGAIEVKRRFYADDPTSYTMVTIRENGTVKQETLIDANRSSWKSGSDVKSTMATIWMFLKTGVGHILSGPDHILFVLGLVMLGGTLKSLLKIVTAFTLAHSITLTLAVTGLVHPNPRIVEPLIALSIVAVAVENLRKRSQPGAPDYRAWIAFGFGLIHGFGFADALTGIGLRGRELALGLVSFNVGVEMGQACIICLMVPLIAWCAKKWVVQVPTALQLGSIAIGMIGSYWCVSRIMLG
jgi:hydrogenase/urease accessory protein HupE